MRSPGLVSENLSGEQSKVHSLFSFKALFKLSLISAVTLMFLYAIWALYLAGESLFAVMTMGILIGLIVVFGSKRFYTARFVFPAVVTMSVFVIFPLIYTCYVGFTNYSGSNLLNFKRVTDIHLQQVIIDKSAEMEFALVQENDTYRFYIEQADNKLLSDPVRLDGSQKSVTLNHTASAPVALLATRDLIKLRAQLKELDVITPDGTTLSVSGLKTVAPMRQKYRQIDNETLKDNITGQVLVADHSTGFYKTAEGEQVAPGWRVNIGWNNFKRVLFSEGIRAPMLEIFIWTISFAALSVITTFSIGILLASILQWQHLRFRGLYRLLLILPYAVPGFISILVFRGLFNQNFGEINMILEYVFGIRPEWFTNPILAKAMTLLVNTWLGYPYMMLLAMGYLQSVPEDHAKAAALEGASPIRCFFSITLPQILPPFLPMLISSFAFNFNNVVLILLLTRGLPDIPGTLVPAGATDLLGSFTYRISFMDSGQNFGLAGAIASMIFIIVGLMAYANFVALRRAVDEKGR